MELQRHKNASKITLFPKPQTKEKGIYLESSTEKGLEIVELDSVGGALDVRLKQEQNPTCEEAAWDPGSSRESQIVL